MTVTGQTAVSYTYDNANRLTQITRGTPTVFFAYDNANRRSSLTLPNGIVMSYSYDNGSQLTGITYTLNSNTLGNLLYSYDLAGRRTSVGGSYAQSELPLAISTTSYNADNQLTTWGTANLYYDLNGNMTSDGTNSFVWNARNQLASMNLGGVSFQYDGYGRRTGKTISSSTTNYLYDGANIVQELSGTTVTANLLSGGIDEVFTRTDSNGTANFLPDGLGSTVALTNSSGSTLASYAYEPFGNATVTSGSSANPYQYTGRENDGTGLYFYRARYYNPTLQRFVSEDPKGFSAGETNLQAFVGNSPTNFIDPRGLDKNPIKQVNQCAAELSQTISLNPWHGNFLADALLGNTFGTISQAITGPQRGSALGQLAIDNPIPKASLNGLVQAGISAIPTGAVTTTIGVPISYMPGTYNPVTLAQTATTVGDTTVGAVAASALETLAAAKVVVDASIYLGSILVCSEQQ